MFTSQSIREAVNSLNVLRAALSRTEGKQWRPLVANELAEVYTSVHAAFARPMVGDLDVDAREWYTQDDLTFTVTDYNEKARKRGTQELTPRELEQALACLFNHGLIAPKVQRNPMMKG